MFLDLFSIECCAVLVEPPVTSSLSSFAWYRGVNVSKTKKDIPERKTAFFFALKGLSNKQESIFTS